MEKSVLKVNVNATETWCEFVNVSAKKVIGRIVKDHDRKGRYYGTYYGDGSTTDFSGRGLTYTDAIEWVSDRIENTLQRFGIKVEFCK